MFVYHLYLQIECHLFKSQLFNCSFNHSIGTKYVFFVINQRTLEFPGMLLKALELSGLMQKEFLLSKTCSYFLDLQLIAEAFELN